MATTLPRTPFKSPNYTRSLELVSVNLNAHDEVNELVHQRKLCGWHYELQDILKWKAQIESGTKFMWWATVLDTTTTPSTFTTTTTAAAAAAASAAAKDNDNDNDNKTHPRIKAGHIALATESSPPDSTLAQPDLSILTVSTFFILPHHRKSGLGRATWHEVERRARQIPNCRRLTIDTFDRRYFTEPDDPQWGGMLKRHGLGEEIVDERGNVVQRIVNADWYARMGFVEYKTEPRYPVKGSDEKIVAVFMRKDL